MAKEEFSYLKYINPAPASRHFLTDEEIGELKRKTISNKRIYWAIWALNVVVACLIVFEIVDMFL